MTFQAIEVLQTSVQSGNSSKLKLESCDGIRHLESGFLSHLEVFSFLSFFSPQKKKIAHPHAPAGRKA